ncbi:MAG: hypothetical protein HZA10_05680 [Nitrospirae bacterium]|nr:hypothetical protein [Nitrospirota bacterium]
MRLNLLLLITLLTILLTGNAVYAETSAPDSEIGRYQLFQGAYTSFDLKRQQSSTQSGIFLLDTKTGKVKRYLNKIDEDGKYIETWAPTEVAAEK